VTSSGVGVKLPFSRWVLGPDITTKFQVLAKEKAYFRLFRWVLETQSTRELYAYDEYLQKEYSNLPHSLLV